MRSQDSDVCRYVASREQLGCELGEREECHDGILPRTDRGQSLACGLERAFEGTAFRWLPKMGGPPSAILHSVL